MHVSNFLRWPALWLGCGLVLHAASPLSLTLTTPPPAESGEFKMGTSKSPDSHELSLNSRSLLLDGRPWTPVMGEFHYSRYPENEWHDELAKMKLGGIDIVATYVFWIHHEETGGQWDWSGQRDLRRFIKTAQEVGLKVIVRCGPWCHGEVRNGGLPDWVVAHGKIRSDDPAYLDLARKLYAQIAGQLEDLLWKDGGPVIGIQLDNEYGGPAEHLLTLKKIARELGLDVPLYTRTGWPALKTPMPFGEIIPLYGVYAEGFWDRELTTMPGNYWAGFHFSTLRTDANIANEALGRRDAKDAPDVARYPYLTCEIGGGMMSAYHRRILVDPRDIEATTLVKIGSGSNSPGYYMYHGGINPAGDTTLMEEQSTAITNWNDMPVKNYDFQAPLGACGQIRPHYYLLRRLHLFLHDFGERLAGMTTALPDQRSAGKDDVTTLRWAARSDGNSGFVFVNNYERAKNLPAKEGVQFTLKLSDGHSLTFPSAPITVSTNACFIWPFNLSLGNGIDLAWATAQPLCITGSSNDRTVFFTETLGVPTYFCFESKVSFAKPVDVVEPKSVNAQPVYKLPLGETVVTLTEGNLARTLHIHVLSEEQSRTFGLRVFPARLEAKPVAVEIIQPAGPLRTIAPGKAPKPVAAAPSDDDFVHAAVWRIKLPPEPALSTNPILRFSYVGDVARVKIGKQLIIDDYYNGQSLEIDLRRYLPALDNHELTISILPLQKNAPIYLPPEARPDFGERTSVVELKGVEMSPWQTVTLRLN